VKILIFIVAVALATLILVVKLYIQRLCLWMILLDGEQEKVRRNDIYGSEMWRLSPF
jgi:hypothetical protein